MKHAIRIISLISYSTIILSGQIIGLPLFLWISFNMLNMGSTDQLFSILGFIGIVINGTKWIYKLSGTIISFLLMLSPLVSRFVQVPMEQFDYLAFKIPFALFVITYSLLIVIKVKQRLKLKFEKIWKKFIILNLAQQNQVLRLRAIYLDYNLQI